MQVKGYSWVGVGADDFKQTVSFFTDVLGLSPVVIENRGVAMLKVAEGQILEVFGPRYKGAGVHLGARCRLRSGRRCRSARATDRARGGNSRRNRFLDRLRVAEIPRTGGQGYALQKTPGAGWEETT